MRGGKRPNSGRKPGQITTPKADHLRRVRQQISLPAWVVDRLKADESNISRYILRLILDDKKWKP